MLGGPLYLTMETYSVYCAVRILALDLRSSGDARCWPTSEAGVVSRSRRWGGGGGGRGGGVE